VKEACHQRIWRLILSMKLTLQALTAVGNGLVFVI
jgi:hypothetical protein